MTAIPMNNLRWCEIKHFKPHEFNEPNKMDYYLINRLDQFREAIEKPIIIHSSYRENDSGYHGSGEAVDIHIVGLNVLDQYLLAEKSGLFNGIGVYSCWNNPGLHLDIRPNPARWGCWTPTGDSAKNIYVSLDSAFIKRLVMECMQ